MATSALALGTSTVYVASATFGTVTVPTGSGSYGLRVVNATNQLVFIKPVAATTSTIASDGTAPALLGLGEIIVGVPEGTSYLAAITPTATATLYMSRCIVAGH